MNEQTACILYEYNDKLDLLAKNRLNGISDCGEINHLIDEPSEDIIINLLNSELDCCQREAIIKGCREIFSGVFAAITSSNISEEIHSNIIRVCRVINLAKPPELISLAHALLVLAIDSREIRLDVKLAAMRAVLGYPQEETYLPVWEKAIQHDELASYAFNGICKVCKSGPLVDKFFIFLWTKSICDNWKTNILIITKLLLASGQINTITNAIEHFKNTLVWSKFTDKLSRAEWGKKLLSDNASNVSTHEIYAVHNHKPHEFIIGELFHNILGRHHITSSSSRIIPNKIQDKYAEWISKFTGELEVKKPTIIKIEPKLYSDLDNPEQFDYNYWTEPSENKNEKRYCHTFKNNLPC